MRANTVRANTVLANTVLANTVLPARRRAVPLHTADGLRLVAALALPADRPPAGTVVCLHPLPTHGGNMDSHLFRKAAWRLPALAGLAVLRYNSRGTQSAEGRSEGHFDDGDAERYDLAAALDLVEAEELPSPWLVGWSFGTEIILAYGAQDATVAGGVLLAPPLRPLGRSGLASWADSGRPLVVVVPEHDDYLRPAEAGPAFRAVPQSRVLPVAGSKHLFVGYTDQVLDLVADAVRPGSAPLARSFPAG